MLVESSSDHANIIDCNKYKVQLIELKKELQDLMDESIEDSKPVELDQTRVGRLSRMEAMQEQAMAIEVAHRRHIQMLRIDAALQRIEEGEFGYCVICGEDIEKERLAIDPAVHSCVVCAES